MTSPKDIIPQKYEVLKLRTGGDIVGMTRNTQEGIEVTLPMICRLEAADVKTTLATFYPYAPLSSDPKVTIPLDMVTHRNTLNEQFIPFYDEASSRWFDMVENKTIPLTGDRKQIHRAYLDRIIEDLMSRPMTRDEEQMLQEMEEDEWNASDDAMYEFESNLVVPKDKKKIH